jgi:hypothetical protein
VNDLVFTLLSDGSSDQVLLPILEWVLRNELPETSIQSQWADLRRLPVRPQGLKERIKSSIDLFPCDLLFIHRDAEKIYREDRLGEIEREVEEAKGEYGKAFPYVGVVPVRMQEAWLLFDVGAIRRAAGNPNGDCVLKLPKISEIEGIPNPKAILHNLLKEASGLSARRRRKFRVPEAARRLGEVLEDYSPLRGLDAFRCMEENINDIVKSMGNESTISNP